MKLHLSPMKAAWAHGRQAQTARRRAFRAIALLLLMLTAGQQLAAQSLKDDPDFRTGKLKNGFTYYIRHNAKEPGLAEFYIAQRVGSILEEPRQRGLAHFLEHMAFNGTRHFNTKGKSMNIVPWCETIGVKFGANLNAYTSVDQTVYNISAVPVSREGIIDSCLLILNDWSHYLLLEDEEIDKERGVIHEEWRTRRADRAVQRMMEKVLPVVYKGTKYEDCLPIGSMEVVDNFSYDALRDYYHKWYRPDLQAIIVVGDIDVDRVEAKIKKRFSKIPAAGKNAAKREYYPVGDNDELIIATESDNEQPIMLANLYMKRDATPDSEKHTMQYQRDDYVEFLISRMVNYRLQQLQHLPVPPVLSASARNGSFFVSRTKDAFSLSFGCRQENIEGSFNAVIGISEQARRHGFTAGELKRAKAERMKAAERAFAERNDRGNRHHVGTALRHFLSSEPMLTADDNIELIRRFDSEVTLEEVNRAVKDIITDRNQVLVCYYPDKQGFEQPTQQELQQWLAQAQNAQAEPYRDSEVDDELMPTEPEAGTIISENDMEDGIRHIQLSNGVNVYVKPTDFSKDQVMMRFYGEGGTSLYPDEDAQNFSLITSAIIKGGVGQYDQLTLQKKLASKRVSVTPFVGDKTQGVNATSSPEDLKTAMQLTHLYITQPRRDDVAFHGEMDRMRSFLTNRDANPSVGYNDTTRILLYGHHPRIEPRTQESLKNVSYDRILDIYHDRFSDVNGFNMILTGNIDLEQLRTLLCQYVASLPSNGRKETWKDAYPRVREADEAHVYHRHNNTPAATVGIYYTFQESFEPKTDLELDMLARCLQIAYTDSVREEKGGTYGISVSYQMSKTTTPNSLLRISFRTDPSKYDELIPIVYRQIQNIADNGPLESSMDKVKKYLLKAHGQNIKDNGYWDYVIYNRLRHGIDYHTGFEQVLESVKAADVQRVAQDMLSEKRRIEVTMISD